MHAPSKVSFTLNGEYNKFIADIGVDDEVGHLGSVIFKVQGDGIIIYESEIMKGDSPTEKIDIDISDYNKLELIVSNAGDNQHYDHADWAGAQFLK